MKKLIPITILIIFAVYMIGFSWMGYNTNYETTFYGTRMEDAQEINSLYHLDKQPAVLYLEPGDAPYFIHANSSCRYISPLLIARYRDNWNISYLKQYQEEYNCIEAYRGKYIVMELGNKDLDWFGEYQTVRQPLRNLIMTNYTEVYHKSWRVLEKN